MKTEILIGYINTPLVFGERWEVYCLKFVRNRKYFTISEIIFSVNPSRQNHNTPTTPEQNCYELQPKSRQGFTLYRCLVRKRLGKSLSVRDCHAKTLKCHAVLFFLGGFVHDR